MRNPSVIEQRRQIGEARVLGDILERDRTVERDHERERRRRFRRTTSPVARRGGR